MPRSLIVVLLLVLPGPTWAQPRFEDFTYWESVPGPLRIDAGKLVAREGGNRLLLTDGVRVFGGNLTIRADWMEIQAEEQQVVMAGSVRIVEGTSVLLCDRLELDRRSSVAVMHRATIYIKTEVTTDGLTACRTASQLAGAGFNAMTFQGERLVRDPSRYEVDTARFTACDCGDEAPSWEIRASRADVVPGERAWLTWPVLYIKGVPVFVLPVAYLPLSERRTGLLFPQVNFSGRDGFVLSESLFVTLGASADTTFSLDWFEERGFRERLEFRAVPSRSSRVEARFSYIDDEKAKFAHRASGELTAWARGSSGGSMRAAVRLYSDNDINRDFQSEMAGRAAEEAPSGVVLDHRGDHALLAFDAVYHQDLRFAAVDLTSTEAHDTIQRAGAFSFHVAPVRLFDFPLELSLFAEVVNLSSFSAAWRDWGVDGTPDAKEPRYEGATDDPGLDNILGGEGDRILGDGELRRAVRFLLQPEIRLPVAIGRVLRIEPRVSHRQMVYLPHGPLAPDPSTQGITFAGVSLGTELSRSFGKGPDRIGHAISPWIRAAGAWRVFDSQGPNHYLDLYDRLLSDAVQLLLGLDSGLFRLASQGGWLRFLNLALMQGVNLKAGSDQSPLSQGAISLEFSLHPLTARLQAAYDWEEASLAEVDYSVRLRDRRGDFLQASYLYLPSQRDDAGRPLPLSERAQQEEGLLFGLEPLALRALGESVHVVEGRGGLYVAGGLSVSAGASLDLRELELSWYGGGIAYRSDCRCWGVSVTVRMLQGQDFPDVFFLLDLAYLGTAGVGTNTRF